MILSGAGARAACVRGTVILHVCLVFPVVAADGATPGPTWEGHLAEPLSPGSVALLVEHASDPRVVARWSEALKDSRPSVRAAAARAINVTRAVPLLESLTAARAGETDPVARAEETAALAALGDPRGLEWRAPTAAQPATWRTASGFPSDLVPDVLKVSGCVAGKKEDFHGGQVSYGPDGRPRQVAMLESTGVPPACEQAARALLLLSLAPPEAVGLAGRTDLVIVPLAREVTACMGEPPDAAASPPIAIGGGGRVQEPRLVRRVAPWYPKRMQEARIQGSVILEATVAPSGCMRAVKLLRGVHPQLDIVALLTVAQWRYSPTLIAGAAVPVQMTVTINFRVS
jgi:TonB family protein